MAESIGDFFVNFFFKTDKASAAAADQTLKDLGDKYKTLTSKAFAFNEITTAFSKALSPVKALAHSILSVGDQADKMNDFAMSVGASVESLQRMQYVGEMTGTSIEGLNQGTKILARQLHGAAEGKDDAVKTFRDLGVAFKDSNGHMREVGKVMPDVIAKIAALPTDGQKAQAAMDAFGKAGLELLPMLKKSKEELAALGTEFDALGGGFNEDFVNTAAAFGDNMDRSRQILSNMRREIASSVLPTVNRLLERFTSWGKSNWPDIKEALNSFGKIVSDVFENTAVDAIDTFLKTTQQLFKDKEMWETMIGVFKAVGLAFAGWIIFSNPAVAVVGSFVAFIIDLFGAMQGKDSLVGRTALAFHDWFSEFHTGEPLLDRFINSLKNIGAELIDIDGWVKDLKSGFGLFPIIGNAIDAYTKDLPMQQLNIEKRKALEGLDSVRGKAAMDAGLMSAKTGAEVNRIANLAATVNINVAGSPGMDARALAREIREQVEAGINSSMSNASNNLVTEGP